METFPINEKCEAMIGDDGQICLKTEQCTFKLSYGTFSDIIDHFHNCMVISLQLCYEERRALFRVVSSVKREFDTIRARTGKMQGPIE